jgi:heparin binding hemagglutinin HbhA
MAIADDLRKTLTDPTPLYFAAGTADIAMEQAKKVPGLIEQLRAEAPARIDAVRNADPKAVQDKVTGQAKEAQATVQAKVTEVLGSFDTDFKKLGESAQDLALRGVGVAAEYAVRARETYEKVAERGEKTVRSWRGEAAEELTEIAVAVEPEPARDPAPTATPRPTSASRAAGTASPEDVKKPSGRRNTPRKSAAKKTTPATDKPGDKPTDSK